MARRLLSWYMLIDGNSPSMQGEWECDEVRPQWMEEDVRSKVVNVLPD